MIIGIPKELPPMKNTPEMRVGLSPMGVKELVSLGLTAYVESKAGEGSGFSDEEYIGAGASIVYSKEEAYQRADIVLKVRRPQPEEYELIRESQTLMGYFHLVTAPQKFLETVESKQVTILGYEIIQKDDGRLPLVIPMSEIAGKLSVQIAGRLLESHVGGKGILLGGVPGIPPGEVVILGAGTLGYNAAMTFAGIGATVYVLDNDRDKLDHLARHSAGLRITTLFATQYNLEKLVRFADVVVGAVLVPGRRSPVLITEKMIETMQHGSVFIDFSIDQGGCSETSCVSPCGEFIYTVHGVIHFCMPNGTTLVARTASHTITASILPYLKIIARSGLEAALQENPEMNRGIYVNKGEIKREYLS